MEVLRNINPTNAKLKGINPKEIMYHGSPFYFDFIDLSYSRAQKDFGKGFYLGSSEEDAIKMAGHNGYVYIYHAPIGLIKTLNFKRFNGPSQDWVEFILSNRLNLSYHHNFDAVYGPIADAETIDILDSYIDGVYGKVNSSEAKGKLGDALKTKVYGMQMCLCTQRAVDLVQNKRLDYFTTW